MSDGPQRPRRRRRRGPRLPRCATDQLASAWAWELAAAGVFQRTRAELELGLSRPAAQLLEILAGDPFRPGPARAVGRQLVALGAVQPDALRRTVLLVADGLPTDPTLPEHAQRSRCHQLLAELVTGWVEATQVQILNAQDNLRAAVDTARAAEPVRNPWFDDPSR